MGNLACPTKKDKTHSIVILGHISKLVSLKKKSRVKKVWIKKGEGAGGRGGGEVHLLVHLAPLLREPVFYPPDVAALY